MGSDPSPSGSGAKHGAPRLARTKKGLHPPVHPHLRSFLPPLAFLCLPEARSPDRTRLWRAQGSAFDSGAALNIPRLARYLARFRGRLGLRPGHWPSQQRESYQRNSSSTCYPRLTLVADKEQIFCRLNMIEGQKRGKFCPRHGSPFFDPSVPWRNRVTLAQKSPVALSVLAH